MPFSLIRPLLLSVLCLLFAGNIQAAKKPTEEKAPLVELLNLQPLLYGISEEDLAKAKLAAKERYHDMWGRISTRSRFVRHRLVKSLEKQRVPELLQVIPIVESTYNPYALSYAGAVGLWQLMPRTAKTLGIKEDRRVDGSRHVEQSTEKAAQYLLHLYDIFDNWPLTIAAYNAGLGTIGKYLKKRPWNIGDSFSQLPAPAMTREYVTHVIGLIALLDDGTLTLPEPVKTRPIKLLPPVDVHRLAHLAGINNNDVFRFNPSLNQVQYLNQPVTIHVPETAYDKVQKSMSGAEPKLTNTTVKRGDSLWSLAKAHHTSIDQLKLLNHGVGDILKIGQKLKIPATPLVKAATDINPLLDAGRRIRYRVRRGDSLWLIASRFGTTVKAIAKINSLSRNSIIRPGDRLWVLARIRPS